MKRILVFLGLVSILSSCTVTKIEPEMCVHTGFWITVKGDTMPWTTTNYIDSCRLCNLNR